MKPHPTTFVVDDKGVIRATLFHEGYKERHTSEELIKAVKQIRINVGGIQGGVSNLGAAERLFAQIKQEKGRLDSIVRKSALFCDANI